MIWRMTTPNIKTANMAIYGASNIMQLGCLGYLIILSLAGFRNDRS